MKFTHARNTLIEKTKAAERSLKSAIDSGHRDYALMRASLAEYEEYLTAADALGALEHPEVEAAAKSAHTAVIKAYEKGK